MKKKAKKNNLVFYAYNILLLVILFFSLYFGEYILWLSFMFLLSVFLIDLIFFSLFLLTVKTSQNTLSSVSTRLKKLEVKYEIKTNPFFFVNSHYEICYINSSQKQQFIETSRKANKFSVFPNIVGPSFFGLEYINISSFFGIFSKKIYLRKKHELKTNCLITPIQKEFKLSPVFFKSDNNTGNLSSSKKGNEDFAGARPYAYGDSLKRINFKKSSVLKKAIVNEYDSPNSYLNAKIYIEKASKKNYTEVAEAIMAIYNFYKNSNIHDCSVNFWNGQIFEYNEDSKNSIPLDLANFEVNPSNDPIDFEYRKSINAIVISEYNKKRFLSFVKNMSDGAIVFLTNSALEHKKEIVDIISNSGNTLTEFFVLSQNDYLS